eukprot:105455-Rhodomonas_salina.1
MGGSQKERGEGSMHSHKDTLAQDAGVRDACVGDALVDADERALEALELGAQAALRGLHLLC